ncbi:MAG: type I-E CRISPR-associated protein Cas6/Cse3/CasE [Myxococcota bacterium]
MVQLDLDVPRLLARGKAERLPLREVDLGYLVHSAMASMFGSRTPKPFSVASGSNRWAQVVGYAPVAAAELEQTAQQTAPPDLYRACRWDTLASKPMPERIAESRDLRFEVRACPIVRTRRTPTGDRRNKPAEVDAFLAACWAKGADTPVRREDVYTEWLRSELEGRDAARLAEVEVARFSIARLLRRTHEAQRKARRCDRPDVTLRGRLQVTEPAAFARLLARGVGRHRAFGFGMLLLQPA